MLQKRTNLQHHLTMSIFAKPYPKDSNLWKKIFTSFIFGNFIFIFLIIFQPFGLSEWKVEYKALRLAGYGLITTLVVLFNSVFIESIFKKAFDESRWNVWKEISWAAWNILLIGGANLLYSHWQIGFRLNFQNFLLYQWITLAIGIIPVTIITLISYNRLQSRNLKEA